MKTLKLIALALGACMVVGASCGPPNPPPPPPPPVECKCVVPNSEDPGWKGSALPSDETIWNKGLFEAGRVALGDVCGKPAAESLAAFATWAQTQNVCAEPWSSDAVLVSRPGGQWEQLHPVRFTDFCWASSADVVKGVWVYTNPKAKTCDKVAKGGK